MSKIKSDTVEGVILHGIAIFRLFEWNSTKTWESVQFDLRNLNEMSKMKSDTVEGVILHDFAIFGLYKWKSAKTWAPVEFDLRNLIKLSKMKYDTEVGSYLGCPSLISTNRNNKWIVLKFLGG